MKLLILGFRSKQKISEEIEKLIAASGVYLFTVVCGGVGEKGPESLAEQWARENGAPVNYIIADTPVELMDRMAAECDYILLEVCSGTPQWHKNLLMKFKMTGKHGTVVQGGY